MSKTSAAEADLASNRFDSTESALAFVEGLHSAGAVKVAVDNINNDKIEMEEGGPYADALILGLPDDPAQRRKLFSMANPEFQREGFEAENDAGQKILYFW